MHKPPQSQPLPLSLRVLAIAKGTHGPMESSLSKPDFRAVDHQH